ncbi:MAG: hypothetical protein D4R74_10570 [Betaproteobacteria bacterium]|nr:MAG: hypothetical protein D4R74_10570 [Betaproteobacteria bacterium]
MSTAKSAHATGFFAARELRISPERVLRVMGYRDGVSIRTQIRRTAEAMATVLTSVATPTARYRRVQIASCGPEGLLLSTGTSFRGPTFAAYLSDCAEAAIFILSLGNRFDSTQKHLTDSGHSVEAYMLEIAGWLGIEEATRLLRTHLDEEARSDGLQLTRRMAPGYTSRVGGQKVEWPLEDQLPLFSLFDESTLPARLLEGSCAMTPKMSRSGLYGLHRSQ